MDPGSSGAHWSLPSFKPSFSVLPYSLLTAVAFVQRKNVMRMLFLSHFFSILLLLAAVHCNLQLQTRKQLKCFIKTTSVMWKNRSRCSLLISVVTVVLQVIEHAGATAPLWHGARSKWQSNHQLCGLWPTAN